MTVENTHGGYAYLPGSSFASGGVIASPGMTIERAVLPAPAPLPAGYQAIVNHLERVNRPLEALCGIELRMPTTLQFPDFMDFNRGYNAQLDSWNLRHAERIPLARTNVAPTGSPPQTIALAAFSYTVPRSEPVPAFVISGTPELPDGAQFPQDVVRPGETTDEAISEKVRSVVETIGTRLRSLGTTWDDTASVHLYSKLPVARALLRELATVGVVPAHGITWHDSAPPVPGLELEVDVRRYAGETVLLEA